jgi:hypothetical protein
VTEPGPAQDLRSCGVGRQRLGERVADALARSSILQTDKIDGDATAEIAQPDLPRDDIDSGEIYRKPGALGRPCLRAPTVDVDQHGGPGRLDMDRAAAAEDNRFRQRPIEHRVELNRPLGLRVVLHLGIGKDRPEFRDDGRIVDKNPARCCR